MITKILEKITSLFSRNASDLAKLAPEKGDRVEGGILHVSDLHVTDESSGSDWRSLAQVICDRYSPDRWIVVVTGDIVDHGRGAEYAHALPGFSILRARGFRIFIAPGNHDYGPWGNMYSPHAHRRFLAFCEFITGIGTFPHAEERKGWRLLLLDSTAHDEIGEPFARGRIGPRQLAWLEAQLADPRPTYIAMHHRPDWGNAFLAVSDRADLQALVDRRTEKGRIVKYLCGHKHEESLDLIAAGKLRDDRRVIEIDPLTGYARSVDLI